MSESHEREAVFEIKDYDTFTCVRPIDTHDNNTLKTCTKQASQQIHSHIRVLNGTSKLPWPNNVPRYASVYEDRPDGFEPKDFNFKI